MITFNVRENRFRGVVQDYTVHENDGPARGKWVTEQKANAHAQLLTHEHANGRVAQAHCTKGHACDRDRVHVHPRDFTMHAFVVLCDEHKPEFAQ